MPVSTHFFYLLREFRRLATQDWVAATVVSKERSSYRLPGAMTLVDPDGESLGLVSGGCLEADIRLNARKVQAFDQARTILYDSMDEENIAAELGLGCNGRVEVLVQPLSSEHASVLLQLLERMENGQSSHLLQCYESTDSDDLSALVLLGDKGAVVSSATPINIPDLGSLSLKKKHQTLFENGRRWSLSFHRPPINLWVIGGGVDAQPLVRLAATLGWRVTLLDHRPAYGRENKFEHAEAFVRQHPEEFDADINADAAILMTHNLNLDAAWLARIKDCPSLRYVGLLGPVERREEAIKIAGIGEGARLLDILHGPMGIDIGGDIPESVALSTLAQCHQVLFQDSLRRGE